MKNYDHEIRKSNNHGMIKVIATSQHHHHYHHWKKYLTHTHTEGNIAFGRTSSFCLIIVEPSPDVMKLDLQIYSHFRVKISWVYSLLFFFFFGVGAPNNVEHMTPGFTRVVTYKDFRPFPGEDKCKGCPHLGCPTFVKISMYTTASATIVLTVKCLSY